MPSVQSNISTNNKHIIMQLQNHQQTSQNKDSLAIKHLIFKPEYQQISLTVLEQGQKNIFMLNDLQIRISRNNWNIYRIQDVLLMLTSITQVQRITFDDIKQRTIITNIQHLSFPSLLFLNLKSNNIESIQLLSRIQAPNLKRLSLSNNHITCIKSLRKIYTPNLVTLFLQSNPIYEGQILTELYESALQNILLQNKAQLAHYMSSINWYFKLESHCPRLGILSEKRLKNKRILTKLKQKIFIKK